MQKVKISDVTLRENSIKKGSNLGFKEKIEIAKKLDKLNIDVILMEPLTIKDEPITFIPRLLDKYFRKKIYKNRKML